MINVGLAQAHPNYYTKFAQYSLAATCKIALLTLASISRVSNSNKLWGAVCAKTNSNCLIYKQHTSYDINTHHL